MKVIFLDIDGVLNSNASLAMEDRKREGLSKKQKEEIGPSYETFCHVCCSNLRFVLENFPQLKIVISSTWREHRSMEWLKNKFDFYGIDSSRIIDRTPSISLLNRGEEIAKWLEGHEDITKFAILDDNAMYEDKTNTNFNEQLVSTLEDIGFTLLDAQKTIKVLGSNNKLNIRWR